MAEGFPLVRLIDFILIFMAVEIAVMAWRARTGSATAGRFLCPPPGRFLPTLLSGAFLVMALRAVLADASVWVTLACLNASLAAHLIDLWRMHKK